MRLRRTRALVACVVAFAVWASSLRPAAAATPEETPEALQALALLDASCEKSASPSEGLPEIKSMLGRAGRRSIQLAQESPTAAPTETPPAGNPGGTPIPGVSPTPQLQRPPIAPGVLIPPTAPGQTAPPTAPPVPTPTPSPTISGPIPIERPTGPPPTVAPAGGTPTAFPTATPTPGATATIAPLEPGKILLLADKFSGSTKEDQPQDFSGNVNLFYDQGVIVGDHAHYDGVRYLDFTGNPYIRNHVGDTVLRGDIIRFDRQTQQATLLKGVGETTEGVERGKLHFRSQEMVTHKGGNTEGKNAFWTTCENARGGYHMESKSFDLRPGDKLVARKVTVYLGGLAIFYLPVLVIGLAQKAGPPRSSFLPEVGFSQAEGAWIKTRFGFGNSPYYYGYYRVEYFTKLGLGLGYTAIIGTHNRRRQAQVDFYRSPPKPTGGANNFSLNEQDQWTSKLRSQIQAQYISNYGPLVIGQPPSLTVGGSVGYTGSRSNSQLTFQDYRQSSQQGSLNLGLTETLNFRQNLTEAFTFGYTRNYNQLAGVGNSIGTTNFQSLTNYSTPWATYSLNYQRQNSETPSGKYILPELQVQPRAIFPYERLLPITMQFLLGEYTEPQTPFSTARGEVSINFGPLIAHFWGSDFTGSFHVRQDAYATGDLKAELDQQLALTTPFGKHILNSVTYSETNSNGPQALPFTTFDLLSGASHGAQDVLQLYNRDVWVLRLADGTAFNRQAQPLSYSLTVRPSFRSYVSINGAYNPGPGNGFYQTQFQLITPFGYKTDLQFATNIDWKNKGRLVSKTIFLRKIIGDCYDIRASYNQDLKLFSLGFDLLAYPSHGVNFGLGQTGSIIPGNLTGAF
ncbi:MAG: hypothetical protein JO359_14255 [Candidatus Eremiobacteraeota bacterium]|nr:hypothetical protein [Candidatus Eremiobacteraeota bacterium]